MKIKKLLKVSAVGVCVAGVALYTTIAAVQATGANEFYTPNSVQSTQQFETIIRALRLAPPGSTIIIHSMGTGGAVPVIIQLMNAMKESKATVVVEISGAAYSAHAVLACAADKVIVRPGSFLMFHPISVPVVTAFGVQMVPAIGKNIDRTTAHMYAYAHNACVNESKLLTQSQWNSIVLEGSEVYLYGAIK